MVFFEYKVTYTLKKTEEKNSAIENEKIDAEDSGGKPKSKYDFVREINEHLGVECGLDGNISVLITEASEDKFTILSACKLENVSSTKCKFFITDAIKNSCDVIEDILFNDQKELGIFEVEKAIRRASRGHMDVSRSFIDDLGIHFYHNARDGFLLKERCVKDTLSYEQAIEEAKDLMADDSLLEELERIYSPENSKKYYGNPVHYKISVGNIETAYKIAELLMKALNANNRILGSRLGCISNVAEYCYDEDDIDKYFKASPGNAIAIEMAGDDGQHGVYASAYERVSEYFTSLIGKYNRNTLVFLLEDLCHPGFSNLMVSKAKDKIDIIEIEEGAGDYDKALAYFKNLSADEDFKSTKEDFDKLLPSKKLYTVSEVYDAYNKWYGSGLRDRIYKAYKTCELVKIEDKTHTSEPYDELQNMIGLTEIKEVVDQIIASGKMSVLRSSMGLDAYKPSMHMIFTGNPGSAKTTVARLLAQILKKEGVLGSGAFVEVGRADLIAKYVGWTAKTVREKFRQADGGILFIDEAYSLVDGSNSFGDEAINTIVQEMENHREKVMVIFAGYPEKMKDFLDKNEGLRSRIAFHLNFPDYNADEMWQILKLMTEKKGYKLQEDVESKCMEILKEACAHDEFGNGRFARNILEQAEMHQSQRVFKESKGKKISKQKICTLTAADFDNLAVQQFKEKKSEIGFAC